MKQIEFNYLKDWKTTNKFKELYHRQVNIIGKLDKNRLSQSDIETISYTEERGAVEQYDKYYACLVDKNQPDKYLAIYMGGFLRKLLKKGGYPGDYNGPIRIYGEFGGINTTKTNIGKIWRVDILDKNDNLIDTIEA